jgi:hypothetical protein
MNRPYLFTSSNATQFAGRADLLNSCLARVGTRIELSDVPTGDLTTSALCPVTSQNAAIFSLNIGRPRPRDNPYR